jgi:hypothetical protein
MQEKILKKCRIMMNVPSVEELRSSPVSSLMTFDIQMTLSVLWPIIAEAKTGAVNNPF